MWHAKMDEKLIGELVFLSCTSDPCVYVRFTEHKILIIALYVDDLLIAGDDKCRISWIKGKL